MRNFIGIFLVFTAGMVNVGAYSKSAWSEMFDPASVINPWMLIISAVLLCIGDSVLEWGKDECE